MPNEVTNEKIFKDLVLSMNWLYTKSKLLIFQEQDSLAAKHSVQLKINLDLNHLINAIPLLRILGVLLLSCTNVRPYWRFWSSFHWRE